MVAPTKPDVGLLDVKAVTIWTIALAQALSTYADFDYHKIVKFDAGSKVCETLYAKVAAQPSHSGKYSVTDRNGVVRWYEIVPGERGINVKSRGVLGNGDTADSAKIVACNTLCRAMGVPQYFPAGSYYVDTIMNVAAGEGAHCIRGDGPGKTKFLYAVPGAALFQTSAAGNFGTATTLSVASVRRQRVLTVVSTANMAAGDYVRIKDATQPVLDLTNGSTCSQTGEFAIVKSIDSATQVTLRNELEFAYTTTATIQKVNYYDDVDIEGIEIIAQAAAQVSGSRAINLNAVKNWRLHNVRFKDCYEDPVSLANCWGGRAYDVIAYNNSPESDETPYTFRIGSGNCHFVIDAGGQHVGRHYITDAPTDTQTESYNYDVVNANGSGAYIAFLDTHPGGSRNVRFVNCHHTGPSTRGGDSGRGFQARGRGIRILGCSTTGGDLGFFLSGGSDMTVKGCWSNGAAVGLSVSMCWNVQVLDNDFNDCSDKGIQIGATTTTHLPANKRIRVKGNRVNGISVNPSTAAFNIDIWDDSCEWENNVAPDAAIEFAGLATIPNDHLYGDVPATAKAENMGRNRIGASAGVTCVSGTLYMAAIMLKKGTRITKLGHILGGTTTAQTNLWMALFDRNLALKAITADNTSTIPTIGDHTQLSLQAGTINGVVCPATFVAPYTGLYYIGYCVVASTVGLIRGVALSSNGTGFAPKLSATSTTGLTNPASCPATAGALTTVADLAWVSVG